MRIMAYIAQVPDWSAVVLADRYVLAVVQATLAGLCLVGLWKDARPLARLRRRFGRPRSEAILSVTRGAESRAQFHFAYGFVSVILLQVINAAEAGKHYKTIISIVDLGILGYLFYLNGWARNKVIQVAHWWATTPERPRA